MSHNRFGPSWVTEKSHSTGSCLNTHVRWVSPCSRRTEKAGITAFPQQGQSLKAVRCDAPDWQLGKTEPMDTSTRESGPFTLTAVSTGNKRNGGKKAQMYFYIL
uniref:Uncharacterized protein n=1 Tax=Mustela putorius furo TaxID=9669 RepID=M3Y1X6_MUSPF